MSTGPDNRVIDRPGEARRFAIVVVAALIFLLVGQQVPATVSQDFSQNAPMPNIRGLGLPERGEHGLFRWSADRVTAWLQPLGYPLYVRLAVQGVRPTDQPQARLEISSTDRDLGIYILPREPTTIEVRLPVSSLFTINPRLDITSTTFQVAGDRRQLGT